MKPSRSNRIILVLVSIVVASLLFFNVNGQDSAVVTKEAFAELELINIPDGLAISNSSVHKKVALKFSGPPRAIDQIIQSQNLHPYADLSTGREGANFVKVVPNLGKISDVTVTVASEQIWLEKVSSRRKRVTLETSGLPGDSELLLASKSYSPKNVVITGPQSSVNQVETVIARLNLADVKQNQQQITSRLEFLDRDRQPVQGVTADPTEATILVLLTPKPQTKLVVVQPKILGVVAAGFEIKRVEVEPNQIEVGGESEDLSRTSVLSTADVDVNDLKESKSFDAVLMVPKGIRTSGRQSVRVRIVVEKVSGVLPTAQ